MDDSAIICDEVIESYKEDVDTEAKWNSKAKSYYEPNFNEKKQPVKRKISIFYLHFFQLL